MPLGAHKRAQPIPGKCCHALLDRRAGSHYICDHQTGSFVKAASHLVPSTWRDAGTCRYPDIAFPFARAASAGATSVGSSASVPSMKAMNSKIDPSRMGARQLRDEIAAERLTAAAVAQACLERVAEREPVIGAWTHLDRNKALAAAGALDLATRRGPLHGIPIGVKDLIDTADLPTEYGSPIYRGHTPDTHAAEVAPVRAAGALELVQTVTTGITNY